jgi:ACR3 family arsenite efflux pump ArsB
MSLSLERLERLERTQINLYAIAVCAGAALGLLLPDLSAQLEIAITPLLAVLIYAMFAQLPFLRWRDVIADRRFVASSLRCC